MARRARSQESGRLILPCVVVRPSNALADGRVLRKRGLDRNWRAFVNQSKEFWGHVRMNSDATMAVCSRPDGAGVEAILRFELNPIWHRITHIMVSAAWRSTTFTGDNFITLDPESVGTGAFVQLFVGDPVRAKWSPFPAGTDGHWRDQQRPAAFHHVYHPVLQRNLDPDCARVLRLVGDGGVTTGERSSS